VESSAKSTKPPAPARRPASGLGYNERKELEALPGKIEELERLQSELHAAMSDPAFFKQDGSKIAVERARLETLERELREAYTRWEELEGRA
jgi:ATP-binding cassette subfamily F protein uup